MEGRRGSTRRGPGSKGREGIWLLRSLRPRAICWKLQPRWATESRILFTTGAKIRVLILDASGHLAARGSGRYDRI